MYEYIFIKHKTHRVKYNLRTVLIQIGRELLALGIVNTSYTYRKNKKGEGEK